MEKSRLETLEMLEFFNTHTIVQKLQLELLITCRQKFAKNSLTIKNQTFGLLAASFMRWSLCIMPLTQTV